MIDTATGNIYNTLKRGIVYMPTSEAQKRAIKNNLTLNCYGMSCHFSYSTDSDIIEMLKSVDNKQAYIKTLIRADILAKGGQTNG